MSQEQIDTLVIRFILVPNLLVRGITSCGTIKNAYHSYIRTDAVLKNKSTENESSIKVFSTPSTCTSFYAF